MAAAREDALLLLEESASAILQSLEPSERSRLLRRMAHALRRSQVRRITAQKGPDGMPWPKRKPRKERQAVSRPIRFLYNKGGQTRVAEMRSWRKDGATITGFDREADDIRTFRRDRIARFIPPQGGTVDPGALDGSLWNEKGKLKVVARKMFLKLKTGSHLTARADAGEAWVAFTNRANKIAATHHYGLRDRVTPQGPETDYPERPLLGYSQADREALLDILLQHVSRAL